MKTKEAINCLRESLKDEGYYISWKANIAMAFVDEFESQGYKIPLMHELSNKAAERFLKALCYVSSEVAE